MEQGVTIATQDIALLYFLCQRFNRCMRSPNNTANVEALVFFIAMVELKAGGVALAAYLTAELALILLQPFSQFLNYAACALPAGALGAADTSPCYIRENRPCVLRHF
jgi:hypothetical protein